MFESCETATDAGLQIESGTAMPTSPDLNGLPLWRTMQMIEAAACADVSGEGRRYVINLALIRLDLARREVCLSRASGVWERPT